MKAMTWQDGMWIKRDITAEEIAEMEKAQAEMPEPEPTAEERLSALEEAMLEMLGVGE